MKSRTIQARIEDQTYEELEFLKKDLGMHETTQVVSFALHQLFKERKRNRAKKTPFEMMEELGLLGAVQGPSKLSETYKEKLKSSLQSKYSLGKTSDEE